MSWALNPFTGNLDYYKSTFSGFTTDDLTEGSTNLYYTDARARAAISETITGIDYDNSTGVFSLTSGYVIPTTTQETNWDTAYGWGDHAGLYDNIGTAAGLISAHESTYNHANYDTAYGWGDHALGGYLTSITGLDHGDLDATSRLDDDHPQYVLRQPTANTNINLAEGDFDFNFAAVGQANALFVQGSDGRIGMGTDTPAADFELWRNDNTKMMITCPNNKRAELYLNRGGSFATLFLDGNSGAQGFEWHGGSSFSLVPNNTQTQIRISKVISGRIDMYSWFSYSTGSGNDFLISAGQGGGSKAYPGGDLFLKAGDGTPSGEVVIRSADGATEFLKINANGSFVFNSSEADADFNVSAYGVTNALFVQGSDGFTGFNTGTPRTQVEIIGELSIGGVYLADASHQDLAIDVGGKNIRCGSLLFSNQTSGAGAHTFASNLAYDGTDGRWEYTVQSGNVYGQAFVFNGVDGSMAFYNTAAAGANGAAATLATRLSIAKNGIIKLGSITNYAEFAEGKLELYGTARVWQAMELDSQNVGKPSTNPPTAGEYQGFKFDRFDRSTEEQVYYIWHVPPDYATGSASIRGAFGFFVENPPLGTGDEAVVLGFEWKKITSDTDVFDFSSGTTTRTITETITDGESAYLMHETDIGVMTTTGFVAGDLVLFRFFRDATNANDTYDNEAFAADNDVWMSQYHLEYLSNKLGAAT